ARFSQTRSAWFGCFRLVQRQVAIPVAYPTRLPDRHSNNSLIFWTLEDRQWQQNWRSIEESPELEEEAGSQEGGAPFQTVDMAGRGGRPRSGRLRRVADVEHR